MINAQLAVPASPPASEPPAKVRRLQPARDDRVPLYVQGYGSRIGLSGEQLVVQSTEEIVRARLMNTSQLALFGNAQITTQALRALLERGIPISFLTAGGWLVGRATGHDTNNIELRIAQHQRAADAEFCLRMARAFVVAKIRNCRTLTRRNHEAADPVLLGHFKQLARKAREAESIESLLGIEGAAARAYFQAFAGMLKVPVGPFDFEGRNRRPPRDPVNALLSFVYALLAKDLVTTVAGVGLDPLLGFYHQPRFGRPALALDLMEELRPLVADSVVIGAINTGVVSENDFAFAAGSCNLKPDARRNVIAAYERRMNQEIVHPIFDYRVSYRRVIEVQARLLSRVLLGEIDEYPAFLTR